MQITLKDLRAITVKARVVKKTTYLKAAKTPFTIHGNSFKNNTGHGSITSKAMFVIL